MLTSALRWRRREDWVFLKELEAEKGLAFSRSLSERDWEEERVVLGDVAADIAVEWKKTGIWRG